MKVRLGRNRRSLRNGKLGVPSCMFNNSPKPWIEAICFSQLGLVDPPRAYVGPIYSIYYGQDDARGAVPLCGVATSSVFGGPPGLGNRAILVTPASQFYRMVNKNSGYNGQVGGLLAKVLFLSSRCN